MEKWVEMAVVHRRRKEKDYFLLRKRVTFFFTKDRTWFFCERHTMKTLAFTFQFWIFPSIFWTLSFFLLKLNADDMNGKKIMMLYWKKENFILCLHASLHEFYLFKTMTFQSLSFWRIPNENFALAISKRKNSYLICISTWTHLNSLYIIQNLSMNM